MAHDGGAWHGSQGRHAALRAKDQARLAWEERGESGSSTRADSCFGGHREALDLELDPSRFLFPRGEIPPTGKPVTFSAQGFFLREFFTRESGASRRCGRSETPLVLIFPLSALSVLSRTSATLGHFSHLGRNLTPLNSL